MQEYFVQIILQILPTPRGKYDPPRLLLTWGWKPASVKSEYDKAEPRSKIA